MKTKTVQEILRKNSFVTITPDIMVRRAAKIMSRRKFGALTVLDADDKLVGIISERDIVWRCLAQGMNTGKTKVSQIMTPNPFFIDAKEDITVALGIMLEHNIRHMPVQCTQGNFCGMLVISDVVKHLKKEVEAQIMPMLFERDKGVLSAAFAH